MFAAAHKELPLFVPGGKIRRSEIFTRPLHHRSDQKRAGDRSGIEYMIELADWYREYQRIHPSAFFKLAAASQAISPFASCRC
jgi:hypothetical protein